MDGEAERSGGSLQRLSHGETKINSRTKIGFFFFFSFLPFGRGRLESVHLSLIIKPQKKKEMCTDKGALWRLVRLLASFRTLFRIS